MFVVLNFTECCSTQQKCIPINLLPYNTFILLLEHHVKEEKLQCRAHPLLFSDINCHEKMPTCQNLYIPLLQEHQIQKKCLLCCEFNCTHAPKLGNLSATITSSLHNGFNNPKSWSNKQTSRIKSCRAHLCLLALESAGQRIGKRKQVDW